MAEMKKDFGPFELHEKIGSGGMASVYVGKQKSLDRKVVLKVLYPHLAEDEKLVARFEREARAAAMMRHPNIVQVIDCGRHEDVSYIAMEFVEGMDLKKWMEKHGPPPLEIAILLVRDLCSGLEHAHHHRIVHRDIKPANIMLTPDGQLKIMDFGLARKGEDSTAMTVVGSVLGTPAYMSPEQATGDSVDERSDIFSAGVVAYELLGGQRPFQGDSYSTVLRAVLTTEPPPLEGYNPLVPDEVVQIVRKMLQKDVSKRYAQIGQVRTDLEALVDQMGMSHSSALLREYASDPEGVGANLRRKRLSRHVDQGLYFENMGLGKIDDALIEFQRALHLDPANKTAREHLNKLEKERDRLKAQKTAEESVAKAPTPAPPPPPPADATMLLPPGAALAEPPPRPAPAPAAARPAAARTPAPAERATPARPVRVPAELRGAPAKRPAAGARNLLIGVGALLVVAIAVVAFMMIPRTPTGPAAPASASAAAPGPSGGAGTPPTAPRDTPASSPSTATDAGGAVATGTGTLEVKTDPPGAQITINGVVQEKKSNFTKSSVPSGSYSVQAEKDGYMPAVRSVTLDAGARTQVSIALEPQSGATGTVTLKVSPYATYYVNDQVQGQPNTMTAQLTLKPGTYAIKAVHPNFEPKVWKNVRVEPGASVTLSHDFLHIAAGSLKVTSLGGWANVYLDGKPTGKTTPAEFSDLKPGSYSVSLVREGFFVANGARTVVVRDGSTSAVEFTISPR